jgi:hypothetical protein
MLPKTRANVTILKVKALEVRQLQRCNVTSNGNMAKTKKTNKQKSRTMNF